MSAPNLEYLGQWGPGSLGARGPERLIRNVSNRSQSVSGGPAIVESVIERGFRCYEVIDDGISSTR